MAQAEPASERESTIGCNSGFKSKLDMRPDQTRPVSQETGLVHPLTILLLITIIAAVVTLLLVYSLLGALS